MAINSVSLPELNVPATLTLYHLTFTSPKVMRDGVECATCTVVSYANNTLVIDVTGFSTYEVVEGYVPPADVCPNLSGIQSSVPSGMVLSGGNCVTSSGGGGGGGGGGIIDSTPPPPIFSLLATSGNKSVTLSWKNPATSSDFSRVKLTRKVYGVISLETTLYEGTAESYTDSAVLNNVSYLYSLSTRDSSSNYSLPKIAILTPSAPIATTTPPVPPVLPPNNLCVPLPSFTRSLVVGDDHPSVKLLQIYLNANGYTISQTGAGSPGNETTYLGNRTAAALSRFQERYASDILVPNNLTKATGNFGVSTRAKLNALLSSDSKCYTAASTPPTPPIVTGAITKWLILGTDDAEVKTLQRILNAKGYVISQTGVGSTGNETTYFGTLTSSALKKFQCAILSVCSGSPNTTGWGATGPKTRAALGIGM